jgi:hypothetical protein
MDVACGEYGTEIVSKLVKEASCLNSCGVFDELDKKEKGQVTSFWTQFSILTMRFLNITFQDKVIFWAFFIFQNI